jgi:hypothetical protein
LGHAGNLIVTPHICVVFRVSVETSSLAISVLFPEKIICNKYPDDDSLTSYGFICKESRDGSLQGRPMGMMCPHI